MAELDQSFWVGHSAWRRERYVRSTRFLCVRWPGEPALAYRAGIRIIDSRAPPERRDTTLLSVGVLQLSQIRHHLNNEIVPYIDDSDLVGRRHADRHINVLSRALAAFIIRRLWDWDPESAAGCVTDGQKDGGIDAIAVDPVVPRILIVQSKWAESGMGSAAKSEMLTFREGIDRLIKSHWDYFSDAIQSRGAEIDEVLFNPAARIQLCFAHAGSGSLAEEVEATITPLVDDLNQFEDIAQFQYFCQKSLHSLLATASSEPIDISVELSDWGLLESPAISFYGHVSAYAVADWHRTYGDDLFATNLRATLPDSEVNDGISETIRTQPELFWYFNNGITVLCDKVAKAPLGGSDRRLGHFAFKGVQVVNGAQTVGSIARALKNHSDDVETVGRVMVRFIELESTAEGFSAEVTKWTNTQNRVGGREFLALDPEQTRIANEFRLDGRDYVFRSGEEVPIGEDGCGVRDAAIALACMAPDIRLTVQAKREVGRLWHDVERAPYKELFNRSTTSIRVWRAVRMMRIVDDRIKLADALLSGKRRNFLRQLDRVLLWAVNRFLDVSNDIDDPNSDWNVIIDKASSVADSAAAILPRIADENYPGYPANLAKNATECESIASQLIEELREGAMP